MAAEHKNQCVGCGVDMGSSNPRQLCNKTWCPYWTPIELWPSTTPNNKEVRSVTTPPQKTTLKRGRTSEFLFEANPDPVCTSKTSDAPRVLETSGVAMSSLAIRGSGDRQQFEQAHVDNFLEHARLLTQTLSNENIASMFVGMKKLYLDVTNV